MDSSIKTMFSWGGAPLPAPAKSKQQKGFKPFPKFMNVKFLCTVQ